MSNKPADTATLLGIYHGATPERIESKIRALLDLEGEVSLYLSGEATRNDLRAAVYRAFSPCEDTQCACNACRVIRAKRLPVDYACPYGRTWCRGSCAACQES